MELSNKSAMLLLVVFEISSLVGYICCLADKQHEKRICGHVYLTLPLLALIIGLGNNKLTAGWLNMNF